MTTFTVPVSGIYEIKAEVAWKGDETIGVEMYSYTPLYRTIKNPKYRWYKFWVKKYIKIDIGGTYKRIMSRTSVMLNKYEVVCLKGWEYITRVK